MQSCATGSELEENSGEEEHDDSTAPNKNLYDIGDVHRFCVSEFEPSETRTSTESEADKLAISKEEGASAKSSSASSFSLNTTNPFRRQMMKANGNNTQFGSPGSNLFSIWDEMVSRFD